MNVATTLADAAVSTGVALPIAPPLLAVELDFDKSLLLQMALLSVLVLVLKPLLFDPMLRVFALREEKTDGAKAEARSMQERAADILSNYEKELAKVRAEANEERERLRRETAKVEVEMMTEARHASDTIISEGRARIVAQADALEKELAQKQPELAALLADKALGREASA